MAERDLEREAIEMVVFVGAESTGKSTLVEHLAREYDTGFVRQLSAVYSARRVAYPACVRRR